MIPHPDTGVLLLRVYDHEVVQVQSTTVVTQVTQTEEIDLQRQNMYVSNLMLILKIQN